MINVSNWKDIEEVVVRQGVSRKAFTGEGATIAINWLQPGHKPAPHAHHFEQIVYIMKGKTRFHVGDEMFILEEGGLLVVPPNVMHYAEIIGDETVVNLDVFTPKREEYVK
ncbi:MAG: cupin domain-containing protein [Firmicutes bacterium]|nr:cupin domain-containing protein [Bacillota bacterium]